MSVVRLLLISALTSVFFLPSTASAEAPPTDRVALDVVTVNGSGCPQGSVAVSVLPDNTGFRVSYRDFIARAGGGVDVIESRKNCQLNIQLHVPQGFTFAIASAEYRGQARLTSGASGLQRTNYYFQGSSDNNFVDHSFKGPLSSLWRTVDQKSFAELVFAPCGETRNLNINTELRVDAGTTNPSSTSSMSMRSTEGDVATLFHFHWKNC